MNPKDAKIIFDECVPTSILLRLKEFLSPAELEGPTICHLFDLIPSGTLDEDWTPRFKEGGWTVISADRGSKPQKDKGKKLPQLCIDYGITLIMLSPAVHNRKAFDKARTIISVWHLILDIAADETMRGKRFMIEPRGQDNPAMGRITERPINPTRSVTKPGE